MNNWKKYKLGELAEVKGGKRLPKGVSFVNFKTEHPYIRVSDMGSRVINKSDLQFIDDKTHKEISRYIVDENDIILSIVGTIGSVAKIDKKLEGANLTENCVKIKPIDESLNNDFLYYFLISEVGQNVIQASIVGSTQPKLPLYNIKNIEINLPNTETQQHIASILSSLDDKIELNRRMNQTLEQIAATLFKKYFVDNIDPDNLPEDWRWGKLKDLIELVYGKALKEHDRKGGMYPVVGSSGIVGNHDSFLGEKNGIVVGRKGNSGSVIWLHENFFPIDTTFYVKDLIGINNNHFYYFLLKDLNLKGLNSDSAVPGLNRNEAYNQEVTIPLKKVIIQFNNIVKSLFEKIGANQTEIKLLTKIKDTLLPKLMSGEIDVTAINQNEPLNEEVLV